MRDFLAWALIFTVVGIWLVLPWRSEPVLRFFNAQSDEELLRRLQASRRVMAAVGLVLLLDALALALALVVLF